MRFWLYEEDSGRTRKCGAIAVAQGVKMAHVVICSPSTRGFNSLGGAIAVARMHAAGEKCDVAPVDLLSDAGIEKSPQLDRLGARGCGSHVSCAYPVCGCFVWSWYKLTH